jgi:mannose/fructose/N-acetylgalactosamine-specific phosphotransferase system component IIC
LDYLLLGIVAGLAAVERKGFLQAMLSRPIALAPVAGLALGDLSGGILLAPPLELLWLGAVNLGAALPVHEALGAAAITGGAVLAGQALGTGVTPAVAALAVAICAPLALAGRKADRLVEQQNERLAARAEELLEAGDPRAAVRENLYGLLLPFAIAAGLAPLGAAAARWAIPAILRRLPDADLLFAGGWVSLVAFGCAAAARALRARKATGIFFAALAVGLVLGLARFGR